MEVPFMYNNPLHKPKTLNPNDRIAVVAPSSPVTKEKLDVTLNSIRYLQLEPILYPSCNLNYGYLSGEDSKRAQDLNDAFCNPEIQGIFCLRGGYGATRILPLLDWPSIKKNPKVFLGYSDITALHTVLNQTCQMATLHGPMPSTGWGNLNALTLEYLTKLLFSSVSIDKITPPNDQPLLSLHGGVVRAPITGGNLSLLSATLGSPYEIDTKGKILFIEDVDSFPYQIDRGLTSLALAGKFSDCAGILLGTWVNCTQKEEKDKTLSLNQIFTDIIKPFQKPTLLNFSAGHTYPHISIPMGCQIELNADTKTIRYLESYTFS